MIGRGGGGRDRPSVSYGPPRFVEKEQQQQQQQQHRKSSGWGIAPPSRHLWVGNLSSHVTERMLSEQFLRFGDLEKIGYVPGRSYAFVDYRKVEDAVIAMRGLQGSNLAGMLIRIEFAKGDKASGPPMDDDYPQYNDEMPFIERGRDSRLHHLSPEKPFDKSRGNSKTGEPSEVLWIGFPPSLNIDELVLRRAFSPFGEIVKITTFPGRSYAFIQYRTIVAAFRAKEALHGKLFNNPRVHICFAKSEFAANEIGRSSFDGSHPPHFDPSFEPDQNLETFQRGRNLEGPGEFRISSPLMGYGGDNPIRPGPGLGHDLGGNAEHFRFQELNSGRRMSEELYERHRSSPSIERGATWRHDIPPFERPRRPPSFDEPWGAENSSFPSAKKLKSDQFPDKELPEYPFSDFGQEKFDHAMPKFFPGEAENNAFNRNFHSDPLARKGVPDFPRNPLRRFVEGDDSWRSFDGFDAGPSPSMPFSSAKLERVNNEPQQPPLKEVWKWEGTIAKGGSPVCRARCFPVGKVLDFTLPEFLNCTARTGLDMLTKHYYQASNTWVVFFVPQTDADIAFYNEFMHYLGEKQRAAVAKLGEKLTLFLVPPSDFSEQVLKVPGKVSISGVVLQFQQPSPNFTSMQHSTEVSKSKIPALGNRSSVDGSIREDSSFRKLNSPDFRPFSQGQSYLGSSSAFPPPRKFDEYSPYMGSLNPPERPPDFREKIGQNQFPQQTQTAPSNRLNQSNASNSSLNAAEAFPLSNPGVPHGATSSNLNPETSSSTNIPFSAAKIPQQAEAKYQPSTSLPLPLQPDQLAQLATLLAQQKQSGKEPISSADKESRQSNMFQNPSSVLPQVATSATPKVASGLPPNRPFDSSASASGASGFSATQISQTQSLQQNISALQMMVSSGQESGQQAPNSSREEPEADPQKRLQATLQLAAALLQQIQQQSKTGDQRFTAESDMNSI
ncbi:flowering time control protein FPA isoform X2 [Ananas comosus]|uniref:Flowering time control protein FPA isoform X2 n=1 Tax=Ananas comosus TaxID=4615 RepID=A0A6P5G4L5_ANACO|nr:flowering time control protein FPA isoform X2 [Ananas comosus]